MTGKRMGLVRSKTSFDDMSTLDRQLPPQERRQPMKPPNNQIMIEKQTQKVSQPVATLSIWSSTSTQEHTSHFLDKCNYCRKTIGDKDEIYMYSSLRAFCSSVSYTTDAGRQGEGEDDVWAIGRSPIVAQDDYQQYEDNLVTMNKSSICMQGCFGISLHFSQ